MALLSGESNTIHCSTATDAGGGEPADGGLSPVLQPAVLGRSAMRDCPELWTLALGVPKGEGSVPAPPLTVGNDGFHLGVQSCKSIHLALG